MHIKNDDKKITKCYKAHSGKRNEKITNLANNFIVCAYYTKKYHQIISVNFMEDISYYLSHHQQNIYYDASIFISLLNRCVITTFFDIYSRL